MKLILFSKQLCILLLLMAPFVSKAQIESSLIGEYKVLGDSPLENIIISSDKVEGIVGAEVIEKFFFFEREEETYILEVVSPEVTSIDQSLKKDRSLIRVNLTQLSPEDMLLNITYPNGKTQELAIRRVE